MLCSVRLMPQLLFIRCRCSHESANWNHVKLRNQCMVLRIPSLLLGTRILLAFNLQDLVFAILIADNQLITLVRMKKYFLHPLDLHLIFNLVSASESFKTAESWTPICLPKFDSGWVLSYNINTSSIRLHLRTFHPQRLPTRSYILPGWRMPKLFIVAHRGQRCLFHSLRV